MPDSAANIILTAWDELTAKSSTTAVAVATNAPALAQAITRARACVSASKDVFAERKPAPETGGSASKQTAEEIKDILSDPLRQVWDAASACLTDFSEEQIAAFKDLCRPADMLFLLRSHAERWKFPA